MGKVITKKNQSMSWVSKTSLVLLLTLTSMVFIHAGLYAPKTSMGATTITSCSDCHFVGGIADGTGRNNPAGLFQGSHSKHANTYALACTKCHVSNTTYDHAMRTVDMALSVGTYSRGTGFAVSNTFSPGNCSNTYCHSNGTGGTAQTGDTRSVAANATANWGSGALTCSSCHGTPPQYQSGSPKMNSHTSARGHKYVIATSTALTCNICHNSVSYSGGTYTPDTALHVNGTYNVQASLGYTYALNGGTCATPGNGCHGPTAGTWGVHLGCVNCHDKIITRTKGRPGTTLANAVGEFGQAWGHRKNGRGAVTDADCIVCHLEGNFTSKKPSPYHMDGNIDLRDPDGAGETPITDIAGAAFTFQRFSTTYISGSRTSTGQSANSIDNVITQKFCLACHDSDGAKNATALSTGGVATMPFGNVDLGANYTVVNGAVAAGDMVDVKKEFATANSSKHPVLGPLNRDFPTAARMNIPYKPTGTRGTSGTLSQGVVLNCFDCHNVVGTTPLTLRTVTAHGNAVTIRGTATVSGTASSTNYPTLCRVCHAGYESSTATNGHTAGSALGTGLNANDGMTAYLAYGCNVCHGSAYTGVVRPVRAQDVHGVNVLPTGGGTSTARWSGASTGSPAQVNARPYAFIRNTKDLGTHNPKKIGGSTYTPGCEMGPSGAKGPTCSNQGTKSYTAGGTF